MSDTACAMCSVGECMSKWLFIGIYGVSGLVMGIIYRRAFSLYRFIREMDKDESVCDSCSNKDTCKALRPIGSSNVVTEFTYTAYQLVRRSCMHVPSDRLTCMLILAILNSVLYISLYLKYGFGIESVLYALAVSILIYAGYIDWNTQYIPLEFNIIIFILGIIRMILQPEFWLERLLGFLSISLLLLMIDWIGTKFYSGNHVIGGGDIKLMAAAGLLLGWKLNIVAFMMGCVCGSIIHLVIMKIGKGEHRLAFGPYLSMGIYIAMICGEQLMSWYLGIMGL